MTDEDYRIITEIASERGITPKEMFSDWLISVKRFGFDHKHGPMKTDDWLRHLGTTDEDLSLAEEIADSELEAEWASDNASA